MGVSPCGYSPIQSVTALTCFGGGDRSSSCLTARGASHQEPKERTMFDAFRKLPGKERLEFGLTITMITISLLAVVAILFA